MVGLDDHGHGEAMTSNLAPIVRDQLRAPGGEYIRIIVADSADSICAACAYQEGRLCRMQAKVDAIEARHARALGIAPDEVLRWGELLDRVRELVAPDDLDHLCAGCPWLSAGMCKQALVRRGAEPAQRRGEASAA